MNLLDFADRIDELRSPLWQLAHTHPGWTIQRNRVGNLAVLNEAGDYVGWVDVLHGELKIVELTSR